MVYQNLVALHVFTPITDRKGGVLLYFVLLNRRKRGKKAQSNKPTNPNQRTLVFFKSFLYLFNIFNYGKSLFFKISIWEYASNVSEIKKKPLNTEHLITLVSMVKFYILIHLTEHYRPLSVTPHSELVLLNSFEVNGGGKKLFV